MIVQHLSTPIGILEVQGDEHGVQSIVFAENEAEEGFEQSSNQTIMLCITQLSEYFEGKRTTFDSLCLHFPSTDFQRDVWDTLMQVPFGNVISYGELAERAGYSGAARAVGTAMNQNPLPIIIPCHRVLPSDGSLGQYAFGSKIKKWLLDHEGAVYHSSLQESAA